MKNLKFITIVSTLFLIVFSSSINAQQNNLYYNFNLGYGYVAQINDFVKGINVDNKKITSMASMNFEIAWQTDGSKDWHAYYKNFHYGLGLFYGHFNYSKNIGNPFGIYSFMGFTPLEKERFSLKTEIALGFSGPWQHYSKENFYNVAVSTTIECYAHARLSAYYRLRDNWLGGLSASFTHFSNGTMARPNKGLNILTPALSVSYQPQIIKNFKSTKHIDFTEKWNTFINIYGAMKGTFVDYNDPNKHLPDTIMTDTARSSYFIGGIQLRYQKHFAFQHSLGLGLDISYNATIGKTDKEFYSSGQHDELSFWDRTNISAMICYEYSINKLSILLEPTIYLKRHSVSYFPLFAQRIGLRYYLNNSLFTQLSLRAYKFHMADYIEWCVGYRF